MKTKLLIVAGAISLMLISCVKKDDGPVCPSGKGGGLTIVAFPEHHGVPIYSLPNHKLKLHVAYNRSDLPGKFNTIITGADGDNFVRMPYVNCGSYYIYMTGWDPTIQEKVFGGIPLHTLQQKGELVIKVPVTEGD